MNKKRVFLAVLILSAIIIALCGIGHMNFRVKESEDTRLGETDIATGEKVPSEYFYEKKENATENRMPKIVDIIIMGIILPCARMEPCGAGRENRKLLQSR